MEFQFEICRVNGLWAYRIRPLDAMGGDGHGDHIFEIACSKKIPNVGPGAEVEIALFPRGTSEHAARHSQIEQSSCLVGVQPKRDALHLFR